MVRRDPPRREVSTALFGAHRHQIANRVECLPGFRSAAPLQKLIGCMQGPCETGETGETLDNPCLVSVLLCKIGNVGHQQRELRFPLDIHHCHSQPPACSERRAEALTPIGSQQSEWRKEVGQCLRILLAALCCQSACPPFQSQVHGSVWSSPFSSL